MKTLLVTITCLLGLLATASAAGFEYKRMVAGVHISEFQVGIANFKHIATGEIEGKILLEPLGTITLPVSGEEAFYMSCLLFVIAGGLVYSTARYIKHEQAEQAASGQRR